MASKKDKKELIEKGYLADGKTYTYDVNLHGLKIGTHGDFTVNSMDIVYGNHFMQEKLIYLTLLKNGSMKVQDISKKTKINRTYLYDIINIMIGALIAIAIVILTEYLRKPRLKFLEPDSKEYNDDFANVMAIQNNVAQEVINQLKISLSPVQKLNFKNWIFPVNLLSLFTFWD